VLLMLVRASQPHVAFLGRVPGTDQFSDIERHPDNVALPGVMAFRPEASVTYVNAEAIQGAVMARLDVAGGVPVRLVVCDLSASPHMDVAGARMLEELAGACAAKSVPFRIVGALGVVRDLLRNAGVAEKVGGLDRTRTLESAVELVGPAAGAAHV